MASRRSFLKQAAVQAAAGSLAVHQASAAESRPEQVNVGLIGVGIRGYALLKGINQSRLARLGALCDISGHYLDRASLELRDPNTPIDGDYRRLLDRDELEAVVIATPDHWHAQMTLDALDAGKDVYVEKPMTYSADEAVRVRDKVRQTGRVTQVGYQRRTLDHFHEARELMGAGALGPITQLQLWSSRNRTTVPWRSYNDYNTPGLPARSGPETVDWARFQANRPARPYDPRRFFHWQCYREYSTGIFGILMSHPLDAANLVLGLGVPESCSATGGIFKYRDGRTVPDTCNCLFNYPSRGLTVSFVGCSNNSFFNQEAHYRGTLGTMELGVSWLRVYAEGKNTLFRKYNSGGKQQEAIDLKTQPVLERAVDYRWSTIPHLDDFFVNVQQRGQCRAPVEECFKATIALAMAIKSYETGRVVRWDAEKETITG